MKKSTFFKTTACLLVLLLCMVFVGFAQGTDDFNTLEDNTSYNTKTTTAGWICENAVSPALGTASTPSCDRKCVIINGKTTAVGSIKSPILSGGCGTLNFVYANAYSESNGAKFLVQIQNKKGDILFKEEVVNTTMQTGETFSYSKEVNISGDFVIYIQNLSPSNNSSKNKDRLAIACINWTAYGNTVTLSKPTITPNGGTIINSQEIKLACTTKDAQIYYTLDGTEPTTESTLYEAPFTITKEVTVKAISVYKDDVSDVVSATFTMPELVTIEGFKKASTGTTVYAIANATFVYRNGRNIYIQDETGGLLVYDNNIPVITTNYVSGDVIPMIYGTKTVYNKLNELIPVENTAAATENKGEVKPLIVTAEELAGNLAKYESLLVTIEKGTFAAATIKNNAVNVDFTQKGTKLICRTGFKNISMTIPVGYEANLTGLVTLYNTTAQIFPRDINDIAPAAATVPITIDFSAATEPMYWMFNNGEDQVNKWFMGKAQDFDNEKLYISSSEGATNKYENSASTVTVSRAVVIPANGAVLSFDYRVNGNANDNLTVAVVKDGKTTVLDKLYGTNDWTTSRKYYLTSEFAGKVNLQFTWTNDATISNQYPAAVDNIVLTELSCVAPTNLTAKVEAANATISWTAAEGQKAWVLEYKLAGSEEWYTVKATTPTVVLKDLQGNSSYVMRVKADCGDEVSDWVNGAFDIECQSLTVEPKEVVYKANQTRTTNGERPFHGNSSTYRYSWSECIYQKANFPGAGKINSISWEHSATAKVTASNVKIYMGNTSKSTHTSKTDFTSLDNLTLVYDKNSVVLGGVKGWQEFVLDNPFNYNGENLIVVISETNTTTYSSSVKFYQTTGEPSMAGIYRYGTSSSYAQHPGTATDKTNHYTTYVPNISVKMDVMKCDDKVKCAIPTNLAVSNLTDNSADISWTTIADQKDFVVEYKTNEETAWTNVEVSGVNNVTLNNLKQNTPYVVRVKAICGENNMSDLTAPVAFQTLAMCPAVSNIVCENAHSATTISWTPGEENAWVLQFKLATSTEWTEMIVNNTPSAVLGGLESNTQYNVRVKALCDVANADKQSQWTNAQFISSCGAFDVPFVGKFTGVTPQCWTLQGLKPNGDRMELNGSDAWLMTPAISIPKENRTYYKIEIQSNGKYELLASLKGGNIEDFVSIYTGEPNVTTTTISKFDTLVVPVPANFNGRNVTFALRNIDATGLYMRNILVSQCVEAPSGLAKANVTTNSVDLTWKAKNADVWLVEYQANGETEWHQAEAYTNPYTLTGLQPGTVYNVRVSTLCFNSVASDFCTTTSFTTRTLSCEFAELPYVENFDSYTSKAGYDYFNQTLPKCWSFINFDNERTNIQAAPVAYIINSSLYYQSKSGALALASKANTPFYAVLPAFDKENLQVIFTYRNQTVNDANGILSIGYLTDPKDADSYVMVKEFAMTTTKTTEEIIINGVKDGARLAFRQMGGTSDGLIIGIDDITVQEAPMCGKPTIAAVSSETTSAKVVVAPVEGIESYEIVCVPAGTDVAAGIPVVTGADFTAVVENLMPNTYYDGYARAMCDESARGYWSPAFRFQTDCAPYTLPYIEDFSAHTAAPSYNTLNYTVPQCWAASTTGTNDQYAPKVAIYNNTAPVANNDKYLVMITSNNVANGGTTIVTLPEIQGDFSRAQISFKARRNNVTYSHLEFGYMLNDEFTAIATDIPVVNAQTNNVYTFALDSVKDGGRLAFRATGNGTGVYIIGIDNIVVEQIHFDKNIVLQDVEPIQDACDLSAANLKITVKNEGEKDQISKFTASYRINGGAAVTEDVVLSKALAQNETYTYTFKQIPAWENENDVELSVSYEGDEKLADNTITMEHFTMVAPKDLPYVEDFTAVVLNKKGWKTYSANNNTAHWNNISGTPTYTYSNTNDAQEYLITPCLNLPAGKIMISYDYNALDVYNENMNVYVGTSNNIADMKLIAQHQNFAKNAIANRNQVVFNNETAGVYYVAFEAASKKGNAGITVDNLSVRPVYEVVVACGENGTVAPKGTIEVPAGEDVVVCATPDDAYHVGGVSVNGKQVAEEDMFNLPNVIYTLKNVSEPSNLYVTFNSSIYNIHKYALNRNANYPENGGTFNPAAPVETVKYGSKYVATMVAAPHYHLNHLYISENEYVEGTDYTNGKDVIAETVKSDNVYTYSIDEVLTEQYVKAVFARDTFNIHYNILAGEGSVENSGVLVAPTTYDAYADYDENHVSTITARPGFHIVNVTVDGVNYGPITKWTFNNIAEAHNIAVEFAPNTYEITTAAIGVGNVSKGVTFTYDPEYTYTFKATPMPGYHIESITRNNVALTIDNPEVAYEETLINIVENYNYVAQFAANTYTITATSGANGLITPAGATTYAYHTDATYEITPAMGYYVQDVKVDGESKGAIRTYTFSDILANHTIEATFAAYQYTITVKSATNGKITPETSKYGYGETPTFEMIPVAGYGVQDVTVDGISVGAVSSYTFPELTANHEIAATFTQYKYTITATANEGGKISPAGITNLISNGTQVYSVTPDKGYHIADVVVDGVSMGAVSTYKFNNVNENHTIYASFAAEEYTITVNQPANGSINPGTITVKYGDMPTFTVSAVRGYEVKDITVDGASVIASANNTNGVYTYTFPAVTKSMTLAAKTAAKQYTITASADANGKITPAGVTTVNFGGNQEYTIVPNEGYEIANVLVDGLTMGAIDHYAFVNVTYNRTISVTFRLMNCEIPSNAHTINIDTTSATLTWYHPTAKSFDVQYKAVADQTYETATVNAMEYTITDLKPSTTYIWKVRANCVPNNPSEWSNGTIFRTIDIPEKDTTGVADYVKALVNVYSYMNNIYIVNENNVQINDVQVYDIYGKLIYAGKGNNTREVISMNVATGNYIVRLFTNQGVANYKLYLSK